MDLATVWPILVVQIEAAVIAVDAVQNGITEGEGMYLLRAERGITGSVWARGSAVQGPAWVNKCHDTKTRAGSRAMMCYLTHL